jgi:bifunctional N-acetylglucosamine-1-phosphate-uridyltransferase/glucosamine-1-phosphate-acetyltransferase GlmU-like protein
VPNIAEYIAGIGASPLAPWACLQPWEIAGQAPSIVEQLLAALPAGEYRVSSGIAIHSAATVEPGATLKPPLVLSSGVFVAAGAYLRGGCWLAEGCSVGPRVELKSTFVFPRSVLAHFNFIGDSVLGSQVNFEAGAVICNYRNERSSNSASSPVKFGALVGDGARIGANAVLAPGTILLSNSVVGRLEHVDQERQPRIPVV